jgi:hypothetical protein
VSNAGDMSVAPMADAAGVKNIVVDMARLPAVRAGEASAISGEERLQGNHRSRALTSLAGDVTGDKANTRIARRSRPSGAVITETTPKGQG